MTSALSQKRALQDLTHPPPSSNNSTVHLPTLFELAIHACISHLHNFATLQGLAFRPFGHALFQEFVKRAAQWRLTTEQRQAGIVLFAEAYGVDAPEAVAIGPEYTGLRCSLVRDIPYLVLFSECLVYLDLSGGVIGHSSGSSSDDGGADRTAFTDTDMAGLSGLRHLRILNLAGLEIGDTGLGHLLRSVTMGSSGPAGLEYLNLSGTQVTDVGVARMFVRRRHGAAAVTAVKRKHENQQQQQQGDQMVFKRLLGIDLTDSKVHLEVAKSLFCSKSSGPVSSSPCEWSQLESEVALFPLLTTKEQAELKNKSLGGYYIEPGTDTNPIQRWIDRLYRSYKLSTFQRPDLAGEDGLGLAECLALAKLGEVHLHPLSEPHQLQQREYERRGEQMRIEKALRRARFKNTDRKVMRQFEEVLLKAADDKVKSSRQQQQHKDTELERMYTQTMYRRVLDSVRSTYGARTIPKASSSKKSTTTSAAATKLQKRRLAFVRDRMEVEDMLASMGLGDGDDDDNNDAQIVPVIQRSTDVVKAQVRNRRDRPAVAPKIPIEEAPIAPRYTHEDSDGAQSSPFSTQAAAAPSLSTPQPTKQESSPARVVGGQLPGRRRTHGGAGAVPAPFQPFVVKTGENQILSEVFVTPAPVRNETKPLQPAATTKAGWSFATSTPTKQPPLVSKPSSRSMMDQWIKKAPPIPSSLSSAGTTAQKKELGALGKSFDASNNNKSNNNTETKSIVREFHLVDSKVDTVNLDRWIRLGAGGAGKPEARFKKKAAEDVDEPPRKVIRFDANHEEFADAGAHDESR
ncbi:hypothetical protein BGZ99_000489 [Dissophora globulifera]|uniref:Leucine rich repeat protein n=1 Tax=Dissophora globulifera TaxID=979702 RepID=A0A9P6RTZ3_9FUNG|nr:hypothetical protein BGZ99_000489 [Dissophora globulifera]